MGLGESDKKIYRQMQVAGDMLKIAKQDRISRLLPFEHAGFKWSVTTEKLERPGGSVKYHYYDTPWCHTRHLAGKHCALDHSLTFNLFGIIPPRCQSCWKTVLTPKNFDELMTWKKVQEQEIDFACKCGIELRDYTPKFYGAYHYADSIDEGRRQYEIVKELATKHMSEETAAGVILKRACTEMEMIKGPSSYWHLTEQDEEMLNLIETFVEFPIVVKTQADFVKPYVMMKWLLWAHMNADMSYLKYNDNTPLFPGYQKYHEGPIEMYKHDLAICHAQAKGVEPEVAEEYMMATDEFARTHNLTLDRFAPILGYNTTPPLKTMNLETLQVAEELVGEHNDAHGSE